MNPDRRDVLKVLSVLGLGGVSALYASRQSSDDSTPRSPTATPRTRARDGDRDGDPTARSPTATGTRTPGEDDGSARITGEYMTAVEQVGDDRLYTASLPEAYTFEYDPVDVRFEDRWIARFVATPAAQGAGDRLRITPGTRSATDLATLLRNWHGVPNERWGETRLAGQTVQLSGGTFRNRVAVFGTLDGSPELLVGARARTEASLDRILSSWTLALDR